MFVILSAAKDLGEAKELFLDEEIRGNDGGTEDMGVVPPNIVVGTGIGIPVSGNISIAIRSHEEGIEVNIFVNDRSIKQLTILEHLDSGSLVIMLKVIINNSVNIISGNAYLTWTPSSLAHIIAELVLSLPILVGCQNVLAIVATTFPD